MSKIEEKQIKAVILIDNYTNSFEPVSIQTQCAFMPICGIPVIEYTFQWLQMNNFREFIILYTQNHRKVQEYFKEYKERNKKIDIQLEYAAMCSNTGQALKHLYERKLIDSQFLLCNGTMVSNINIKDKVSEFLKRYKKDSNYIIASICRKIKKDDRLQNPQDDFAYTIDHGNDILMQMDNLSDSCKFVLNQERISVKRGKSQNFKIHTDLMNTEIYICAYEVLQSFNERDDPQVTDMIQHLLTSEINAEEITMYLADNNEYAAKITNSRIYKIVQDDVMSRYSNPLNIEFMSLIHNQQIKCQDFNKYMPSTVISHRGSYISNQTFIGGNTVIQQKAYIKNSVIGQNVRIGKNSKVINCIIWDGTQIGENCNLQNCIIGQNCKILSSAQVQRGVVIGAGCVINENANIQECSKICTKDILSEFEDQDEKESMQEVLSEDIQNLGENTYRYIVEGDEEIKKHLYDFIGFEPQYLQDRLVDNSELIDTSSDKESEHDIQNDWKNQVKEIMEETLNNKINIALETQEMVDVKMQCQQQGINITWPEMLEEVAQHLFGSLLQYKNEPANVIKEEIQSLLQIWMPMFSRLGPISQVNHQMSWIEIIEDFCIENSEFKPFFKNFISQMYKQDIGSDHEPLTKEALIEWSQKRKQSDNKDLRQFYKDSQQFIQFVKGDFGDSESESEVEEDKSSESDKSSDSSSDSEYEDTQNNNKNSEKEESSNSDSSSDYEQVDQQQQKQQQQNRKQSSQSSSSSSSGYD